MDEVTANEALDRQRRVMQQQQQPNGQQMSQGGGQPLGQAGDVGSGGNPGMLNSAMLSQVSAQMAQNQVQMMQNHVSQLQQSSGGLGMLPQDAANMVQMNAHNAQGMQGSPPYGYQLMPPPFLQHQHVGQTACNIPNKARIQCHACVKLLEYDAGAQYVQCFSCSTMNAVQPRTQLGGRVLSMLCAMCGTTNLAPYGINYCRCGNCHTISQVSHAYRQDPSAPAQPPSNCQQRTGVELSHGMQGES